MIVKVFCVHDIKVGAYLQPFFAQSRGHATRMFSDTVNDKSTQFNKHAEDFTLFELGEYDDSSGLLTPLTTPFPVCKALDILVL